MSDENNRPSDEVIRRLNNEVREYDKFLREMEDCEWRKNRARGFDDYTRELENEKKICDDMNTTMNNDNFLLPHIRQTVENMCRQIESNLRNFKKN